MSMLISLGQTVLDNGHVKASSSRSITPYLDTLY